VTATTTTTIQGVSVLSRQKKRNTDVFELALSDTGIEVRRPGRPVQQMSWNRVSEWEIEERKGYVLLTLRGRGATTPLIVPGWSLDDLEDLMRNVTSDAMTYEPEGTGPVVGDTNGNAQGNGAVPTAVAETAAPAVQPKAKPKPAQPPAAKTSAAAPAAAAAAAAAAVAAPSRVPKAPKAPKAPAPTRRQPRPPAPSRAERRQQARKERTRQPLALEVTWKLVVTIALLGVAATAITLVLLQSAGVISWSFLGPVA
jgi:hypothetical protein